MRPQADVRDHGNGRDDPEGDRLDLPPFGGEDALLAVAAHGLLNPLSAIKGFADLLLERGDSFNPDQVREMLAIIRDRAAFASEVLTDLVRGLPTAVADMLDDLSEQSQQRHDDAG